MNNINKSKRIKKHQKSKAKEVKIDSRTEKRKTGDLGESIACTYLLGKGFSIVGRNYLKKFGEIDIISIKSGVYHFIEVKTVTCVTSEGVNHETEGYRAEENVHAYKLSRLARAIECYILENEIYEFEWVLDLIVVKLNMETRKARVEMIKDIVL